MQAWLDAAASCGLQVMESSDRTGLKAWVGLLEVRIEPCEGERQRARIVVVLPGPLDFIVVRIRPESPGQEPPAGEIEIGDAAFDRRFSIQGPTELVLALLDAEMRGLLLRLSTECRLEISTGSIRAKMSDEDVPQILPLLLNLGRRLTQSMDVDAPRRLAENVKRDPEAGVRLQNLLLLILEHPGDPAAVDWLEALGQSEGVAAAEPPLIHALENENSDVRAIAVSALSRIGSAAAVLPLMELAERHRDVWRTARQAIEAIQSRIPGASPGQLSLAQTEAGQLSLAGEQAGQLSLSDDEGEP